MKKNLLKIILQDHFNWQFSSSEVESAIAQNIGNFRFDEKLRKTDFVVPGEDVQSSDDHGGKEEEWERAHS